MQSSNLPFPRSLNSPLSALRSSLGAHRSPLTAHRSPLTALRSPLLTLCSLLFALCSVTCAQRVRIGAEILIEKKLGLLSGKRIGVICNHTSVLPDGTHLVDTLLSLGVKVVALFGPEHGVRGASAAGETVHDSVDAKTGLPVFSLYGKTHKPTPEMLANVDLLLFDIQDVGARFYTYVSTMAYAIEAAGENRKELIVLDRPNPINGVMIEGPVLDTAFRSFVGLFPIPIRHGMTIGELAKMMVGERWLALPPGSESRLTIIPMEGWKREMWYDETGPPWIPPSPNMKSLVTATVYPGTCLFEGSNVTEGRGTPKPFEYIAAPWIDGDSIASALNRRELPGVRFDAIKITPHADAASAPNPKYKDKLCGGVYIHVSDRSRFRPVWTALNLLSELKHRYPQKLEIRSNTFDRLAGNSKVRTALELDQLDAKVDSSLMRDVLRRTFESSREKYLLY